MKKHKIDLIDLRRGRVISASIKVEAYCNKIIRLYFITDKSKINPFMHYVLHTEQFNFGFKLTLVRNLIEYEEKELHKKFHKQLKQSTERIKELRNKVAHLPTDYNFLSLESDEINLIKPNKKIDPNVPTLDEKKFNVSFVNDYIKDCDFVNNVFALFIADIRSKIKKPNP